MTTKEIKSELNQGEIFGNEAANWFTIKVRPNEHLMICINGEYKFYKNIDSMAKRVAQLINRGY